MTNKTQNPYINASYYTDTFKPNKNAMIQGNFNKVPEHLADFDAFRNRASELVDKIVNFKISSVGGIEFVSETARMFLRKAAAAIVQHWYISGYVVSDLDNSLNIGSLNVRQLRNNESFRKLIPLDALTLIQSSGLWDNKVFAASVINSVNEAAINPKDLLTIQDAIVLFQQKGMFDDNFHVDLDMTDELSDLPGQQRWIKIVETEQDSISFDLQGGNDNDFARASVFISKGSIGALPSQAYIYTISTLIDDHKPDIWAKVDGDKLIVYIEVPDDIKDKHLLISHIAADETGIYKIQGSVTNSIGLTKVHKANILEQADLTALKASLDQFALDIQTIQGEVGKIDANALSITNILSVLADQKLTNEANTLDWTANNTVVNKNVQEITSINNWITLNFPKFIQHDGSVNFLPTYKPNNAHAAATKEYVDEVEARLKLKTDQTKGYVTEWIGILSLVQGTTNTDWVEGGISSLLSPDGNKFLLDANRLIRITIQMADIEDTVLLRIAANKWYNIDFQTSDLRNPEIHQIRIGINGLIEVRNLNPSTGAEKTIPPNSIKVVALHQITGDVYTAPAEQKINDVNIITLEGVE